MKNRSCLLGFLLLAGCGAAPGGSVSAPVRELSRLGTWRELFDQPSIDLGDGVSVRLGIEEETGPVGSGILVYCLSRGFLPPKEWHWVDRVGPLRIAVAENREPGFLKAESLKKASDDVHSAPGDTLFVHVIHLERSVRYRVALFTDTGVQVAAAWVTATSKSFHQWSPFGRDQNVPYDSVIASVDYAALPAWPFDGMSSQGHEKDRLPVLLPESPDPGFRLGIEKGRLILESDVDLHFIFPDEFLLARWWVNGKPFVPSVYEGGSMLMHNGAYESVKNLQLGLRFKAEQFRAKSGDRVDVQVLYCGEGWNWVTNDLELRWPCGAPNTVCPPLMKLSNRATFVVP